MSWPVFVSLLLIVVTIVYPVFMLLLQSLFPHLADGRFGGFGAPYAQMFSTHDLGRMWANSLAAGIAATLLAWALGIPAGWLLARTRLPGKCLLRVSLLVPAMSPPYLVALAYVLLAQDNGLLEMLLGFWPGWARDAIFSFHGVVFVMGITSRGVVGLLVEATLYSTSRRQEEVARCLGTPPWRITLPLLSPALLNAGMLVFIDSVSNFGVAAIMGPRANLPLLPAMIYELLTTWPTDIPLAAALSSILALAAMGIVSVCHALVASRSFLSQRTLAPRLIPLKRWQVGGTWLFFTLLFTFSAGLPVLVVFFMSLIQRWGGGSTRASAWIATWPSSTPGRAGSRR
jgi:iron(III) transport system permease protein